ncbi:MAG: mono/diheme cytochrome c family protein [Paraglaciecola sp.]|jgi:mono/diheme cytochrome c family protein
MRKKIPVILSLMLVTLFGCTTREYDTDKKVKIELVPITWQDASLEDGKDLYLALCSACHGKSGKGDGPAAPAMKKMVPNLTNLAAKNGGEFPRKQVENSIAGEDRTIAHETLDMPNWGRQFEDMRYGHWNTKHRQNFMKQKIYNLTEYLATIQDN